jgi:hypothetical protein
MGTWRHQKLYANFMRQNRSINQWEKSHAAACGGGRMSQLNRIVHSDTAITTYWHCPACSHSALQHLKEIMPNVSIAWCEQHVPYAPGPMAKFLDGMRKAGLE